MLNKQAAQKSDRGRFNFKEFRALEIKKQYQIKIPYAKEIIGDYQCGFRRNRSTTDHIFCIRQVLEKKWEYNE